MPGLTDAAADGAPTISSHSKAAWMISSLGLEEPRAGGRGRGREPLGQRRSSTGPGTITVSGLRRSRPADYDKNWVACDNTETSRFYGNCYPVGRLRRRRPHPDEHVARRRPDVERADHDRQASTAPAPLLNRHSAIYVLPPLTQVARGERLRDVGDRVPLDERRRQLGRRGDRLARPRPRHAAGQPASRAAPERPRSLPTATSTRSGRTAGSRRAANEFPGDLDQRRRRELVRGPAGAQSTTAATRSSRASA